jgi:drug/metabolite transporter (DMT)-like permease
MVCIACGMERFSIIKVLGIGFAVGGALVMVEVESFGAFEALCTERPFALERSRCSLAHPMSDNLQTSLGTR